MQDQETGYESPDPIDDRSILEFIQYNESEFAMQANVPLENILDGVKPGYTNWINIDGLAAATTELSSITIGTA